jgi:uncharacterized protein YqgV (UPF0045/DUF77 family)
MKTSVEISYYPLKEQFVDPIIGFIKRMNEYPGLDIRTNGMSTQVFGEYDTVMQALTKEMRAAFETPFSVFVMKVVNADLSK